VKRSTPLEDDLGEFLSRIELEPQRELHAISKWLQQAELVGGREQQCEVSNRNTSWCPAFAIQEDFPLVEGEVESRLELLAHFVSLVNVNYVFVARSKQQNIEVRRRRKRLSKNLMQLRRHLGSKDIRQCTLADARWPDQQCMIKPLAISEGCIDANGDLSDHATLAD
jgi:hypothetical protein